MVPSWRDGSSAILAATSSIEQQLIEGYGQGAEAVPARRMVAHILHALAAVGWHFTFASDLSKKAWDKDTLYLKPGPPRQRYFFPISFNENDKIRLIDSPNPEVTTAFQAAVSVS